MNSWVAPDGFTAQLDIAASISEQLAEAAQDSEASRRLAESASALRRGSKVARKFNESTVRKFEGGVQPNSDHVALLATR